MDAWAQALEDHDGEYDDNVDEYMKIEDEELELGLARAQTTGYLTHDFATSSKLRKMILAEMEKSTPHLHWSCVHRTGGTHTYWSSTSRMLCRKRRSKVLSA